MTTETRPDPPQPRLLYPLIALVALGLAFDMTFINKVFPEPDAIVVEAEAEPVLTEAGEELRGRYNFAAAMLTVEAAVALTWMLAELRRRERNGLVVGRSNLRLFAFAAFAIPAIFMAIDLTRTHHFAPEPDTSTIVVSQSTDAEGNTLDVTEDVLTDVGRSEQRRDIFLSVFLLVGGVAALGWAMKELMNPTPFLVADDDGILVRVDGLGRPPRRFRWEGIVEVRSGLLDDDGIEVPVLSIRLLDIEEVPYLPAGARAEPPWLHLYADEWDTPAHQIAPFLDQRAARPRPIGEYE